MNLLAHLHLSDGLDAEETAGNVLADFLPNGLEVPPAVGRGIELHRQIDAFTDRHPLVAEARGLISERRRRLASIIVDLAFDLALSRAWEHHSAVPLGRFIADGYSRIEFGARDLGERANRLVPRMRARRWFESYTTLDGIGLTLSRIATRSDAVAKLAGAEAEVGARLPEFQRLFDAFYPQLVERAAR